MGAIVGVIGAFAVIILGSMSDGDPLGSLVSLTAAIIVFGGTLASLLTQFGFGHLLVGLKRTGWAFKAPNLDLNAFIEQVAEWSSVARSQGTLALEGALDGVKDEFQKKALQLIVDNTPLDDLHPILGNLADEAGRDDAIAGELWEAAGGYTPTIGVIGAVLGLIHVMMRLDHPAELGVGIATAFVATIYGVGAANLVFLPLGTRLTAIAERLAREREVMIQGFLLMAQGKSGVMIRQVLNNQITQKKTKKATPEDADEPLGDTVGQAA